MPRRRKLRTRHSQYKAKEKGLPWFAPDSPEFTVIVQLPLALRGKGDGPAASDQLTPTETLAQTIECNETCPRNLLFVAKGVAKWSSWLSSLPPIYLIL